MWYQSILFMMYHFVTAGNFQFILIMCISYKYYIVATENLSHATL